MMTLIGLPSTLPPKSSTAICAAVTEPWPVGVDAGPFISVSTPILTTSSEICASAAGAANIAAPSAASRDRILADILFPPVTTGRIGHVACAEPGPAPSPSLQLFLAPRQSELLATRTAAPRFLFPYSLRGARVTSPLVGEVGSLFRPDR